MRPALESLHAVHLYDQTVQKSATEFVELAVADLIEEFSKNEKIPNATRDEITNKLKSVKLSVMFPDDILNFTKIDGLYNELDFEGNESLPELFLKFTSHYLKLRNKPREHWIKKLDAIVSEIKLRYHADTNILSESELYLFQTSLNKFF